MEKVAKFEFVSQERFVTDFCESFTITEEEALTIYNKLELPKRATKGSAGYDILAPLSFTLAPNETIKIPTGIRVKISDGWFLGVFPRSGLGFKYRLQLNNTVGIIDADYYDSSNEGHIFIKMTNDSNEGMTLSIEQLQGFAQGIFLPFGIVEDDSCENVRDGGMGSTDK